MGKQQTEKDEKGPEPTSDDRQRLAGVMARLSTDQIRFVVKRQECATDREAAEAIGISPSTVKNWKYDGAPVDDAVRLMATDGLVVASELRRRSLAKAMGVKVKGLDSESERIRQGVASEIIEWEMGRAKQPVEHSGNVVARVQIMIPDNGRGDNARPARGATDTVPIDTG